MTNPKTVADTPNFEASLKKLETIVTQMESGDLSLEQSLKQFEEGVSLARQCQLALIEAEQRVEIYNASNSNNTDPTPSGE